MTGRLAVVLHAHLPFVLNHGVWPHGADWLNEAAAETYVPLLVMMRALERDGVRFRLNLALSPVLCEQLASADFAREFGAYLEQKIASAKTNEAGFSSQGEHDLAGLARQWEGYYQGIRHEWRSGWSGSLLEGFRHFMESGSLEILTCAATHGYLPLLGRDTGVTAQLRTAVRTHVRHFGCPPRGIWLPECAYRPAGSWAPPAGGRWPEEHRRGVEELLAREGLKFFVVDTDMVQGKGWTGIYASRFPQAKEASGAGLPSLHEPYAVGSGVAALVRDPDTGLQVWSGEHGYPGDGAYLEFHKKHWPGGLRYWRITVPKSDLGDKQRYEPERVGERIASHAGHFTGLVGRLLRASAGRANGAAPLLTAPYDAELFGHWWFEGPRWLEAVFRGLDAEGTVEPVRLGDALETSPPRRTIQLPEGSWGAGGGHGVWLNEVTRWTWERVYEAEARMEALAGALVRLEAAADARAPELRRVLAQLARSLLLLEASDWQFLITSGHARDYAELRLNGHADDFKEIAGYADRILAGQALGAGERDRLEALRRADFLFPDVDPGWWSGVQSGEAVPA